MADGMKNNSNPWHTADF